jgi:hypothetical protein
MKRGEESYERNDVTVMEENRMGGIWNRRKIHRKFSKENGKKKKGNKVLHEICSSLLVRNQNG